jgi:phage protein D
LSFDELQGKGSRLRTPFNSVFLNKNSALPGVVSIEVANVSHFSSDSFKIVVALARLPPDLGPAYWSEGANDEIEIFAGLKEDNSPAKSLIVGQVDEVEIDPVDQSMVLSGRDLSARFIDNKTAEHFQDQTASQVVQTLAKRRGLKASVTETDIDVGTYYELFHVDITREQSEWDLLMFLAEREGFDLWVSGETLNFQPPVAEDSDPYVLLWSDQGKGNRVCNLQDLKMQRSQTLAKDIIVKVRSWNQTHEKAFVAEAKRNGAKKGQRSGGSAQIYTFNVPNMSLEQAQQYANTKLEDISKHERVVTGTLPGDSLLSNRSLVKLVGTGTSWDQVYHVDTVTRRMSVTEGYAMEFRAKNHSTESTV